MSSEIHLKKKKLFSADGKQKHDQMRKVSLGLDIAVKVP